MKPKLARLTESVAASGRAEPGVVRDCKVLGFESTRGRRYAPEALKEAASLYEGAPVFLDHPDEGDHGPRSVRDKFGWFANVRFVPGDGLRGDFHYNPEHPFAKTFEGWLDSAPDQIGFSHNAFTDPRKNKTDPDGTTVITQIAEVASVDLVSRGATTQGLFESHKMPTETDPLLGDVVEKDIKRVEEDDMGADAGAGGGGYESHLAEMVKAIMTDSSLDKSAKRKKLLKALDLCDDASAAAPVAEEDQTMEASDVEDKVKDESDESAKKVEEAAKLAARDPRLRPLVESHDRLKTAARLRVLESKCRDQCIAARLPLEAITDVFVSQLVEASDDRARAALIEDRRGLVGAARKPRSQSPAGGKSDKKLTADDIMAGVTA